MHGLEVFGATSISSLSKADRLSREELPLLDGARGVEFVSRVPDGRGGVGVASGISNLEKTDLECSSFGD